MVGEGPEGKVPRSKDADCFMQGHAVQAAFEQDPGQSAYSVSSQGSCPPTVAFCLLRACLVFTVVYVSWMQSNHTSLETMWYLG